ncbi:Rid family hydrolase [Streptomyces sp. NPDC046805]|uniref:Rid family hydrolase n=1 Tax=Streptomyces sp. NPDC046805 TaxID=3155134 RepID=UPI003408406D
MAAATQFIDARVSRHIGTYSDAVAIPAGATQVARARPSPAHGRRPRSLDRSAGTPCAVSARWAPTRSRCGSHVLSGTPGLRPDGTRPEDFAEEARQASDNVCQTLRCAGAELNDIVQVRSRLTDLDDIDAYVKLRKDVISHRPAYMFVVVPQLIRPSLCLEIEFAAVVAHSAAEQHE